MFLSTPTDWTWLRRVGQEMADHHDEAVLILTRRQDCVGSESDCLPSLILTTQATRWERETRDDTIRPKRDAHPEGAANDPV